MTYVPRLNLIDTEIAIKLCKDAFELKLADALNLTRVSAPLFVLPETGLNDDLSGVERAVAFDIKETGATAQIVHSLAKWKRSALKRYGFTLGQGLYTDMNAIRRDEVVDSIHSIYVDQWDWERIISPQERTRATLETFVRRIWDCLLDTQRMLISRFPALDGPLPGDIVFITAQELEDMYPALTPKQREYAITKKHGAVFLIGIGGALNSGEPHDARAPDYDDWSLDGDILVYYDELDMAVELQSMGIRVDAQTLDKQLRIAGADERRTLPFHQALLAGELPQTIGGGLGQSRLCMLLLKKHHLGEVHASVWPDSTLEEARKAGWVLL